MKKQELQWFIDRQGKEIILVQSTGQKTSCAIRSIDEASIYFNQQDSAGLRFEAHPEPEEEIAPLKKDAEVEKKAEVEKDAADVKAIADEFEKVIAADEKAEAKTNTDTKPEDVSGPVKYQSEVPKENAATPADDKTAAEKKKEKK